MIKSTVVIYESGRIEEYPSATKAARELNISISTVRKRLRSGEEYDWNGQKIKFRFK